MNYEMPLRIANLQFRLIFIAIIGLILPKLLFSQQDNCNHFYANLGYHYFEEKEMSLAFKYLLKAEDLNGLSFPYQYACLLQGAIHLEKHPSFILNYLEKYFIAVGEDVGINSLDEYPSIFKYIQDNNLTSKVEKLIRRAKQTVRLNLNFEVYNEIKSLRYVDQMIRMRSTKFTNDTEMNSKIDTTILSQLLKIVKLSDFPKRSIEMGSAKENIFIILIHNCRYPFPETYEKIEEIVTILDQTEYWNPSINFMLEDEYLLASGQSQKYGRAMAFWQGDDEKYFQPIQNTKILDSLRLSNYLLPFEFKIAEEKRFTPNRKILLPDGYEIKKNWKQYCKCELLH